MSTGQLIVVAVAIFSAAFVQMLAGFGFALLAMPIMTLAVPVEEAVVIVAIFGLATTGWQSIHLRRDAEPGLVRRLTLFSLLGMPLGLVVLNVVDDRTLRIVLGVSVLTRHLCCWRGVSASPHVGPGLDAGCGFLSGVLNTSLGTNGPPLVFDLQARGLDADSFRATISAVFVFSNIVALLLFIADGKVTERRAVRCCSSGPGVGARPGPRLAGSPSCARRAIPPAGAVAADRGRRERDRVRPRVSVRPAGYGRRRVSGATERCRRLGAAARDLRRLARGERSSEPW